MGIEAQSSGNRSVGGESGAAPVRLESRDRLIRRVLIIEAGANLAVLSAKVMVGVLSGSTAILGDAVHSLTDLANNGVALAAARISAEPPDPDHPYGHKKYEQLAVFALATFLTVVAVELALHALGRFGQPVDTSTWGLAVMLGVLVVNVGVAFWEGRWARRLHSDLLHADARHTLSDILTTVAVIVGWQLAAAGYTWLDPIFALFIAALVFYLAFDLFRRAIPALVDEAGADVWAMIEVVSAVEHVREVRRVRSRASGSGIVADVVVAVDGGLTIDQSHDVADAIERALAARFGIQDASVHIEPVAHVRS